MAKDPLICGKCGSVAQRREPSEDGDHWVWTHKLDGDGDIPRARICVMKKSEYKEEV